MKEVERMALKKTRSEEQARAQLDSISEMVGELKGAQDTNDDTNIENAERAIQEDALSVEIRSDWHPPGEIGGTTEYVITLCTGGPAVRITGDLNTYNEPDTARLEHQDWGTPWTHYPTTNEEEETLLTYARQFYFGE